LDILWNIWKFFFSLEGEMGVYLYPLLSSRVIYFFIKQKLSNRNLYIQNLRRCQNFPYHIRYKLSVYRMYYIFSRKKCKKKKKRKNRMKTQIYFFTLSDLSHIIKSYYTRVLVASVASESTCYYYCYKYDSFTRSIFNRKVYVYIYIYIYKWIILYIIKIIDTRVCIIF
jgi:hypothetical protein